MAHLFVTPLCPWRAWVDHFQVLILIVAFLTRFRNWVRDKRREKRAVEEQAERGEVALVHTLSDDIPFGIRALLEDPEIDGVWNSRANTPRYYDGPVSTCSPPPSKRVGKRLVISYNSPCHRSESLEISSGLTTSVFVASFGISLIWRRRCWSFDNTRKIESFSFEVAASPYQQPTIVQLTQVCH